jgi:SH3 domain-containing YSC84-like protein 1
MFCRMTAVRALLTSLFVAISVSGCGRDREPMTPAAHHSAQQLLVERAADAARRMRADSRFPGLDENLARARAVAIFPRVVRASLVFGGEGGNGVLVARTAAGGWSGPAFYSIGGGSAGLQVGYQEAAILLLFMSEKALLDAVDGGLTLGTDASVAAGTIGEAGSARATSFAADILQYIDVGGGLFAGISLDGSVMGPRDKHNSAYFGRPASAASILLHGEPVPPGAAVLHQALALR